MIDHTLLKPQAGGEELIKLCGEAIQYGFATVCVHPCHLAKVTELLAGHATRPGSVVGFPYGTNHTSVKAAEAAQAIHDGAEELDMVINLPAATENDTGYLARDIEAVLKVCHNADPPVILKVIMETAAFSCDTKIMLCRLASNLGVDFVKTSTGLHPAGGATVADVKLLSEHRGCCRVKAAGGISNLKILREMLAAGAQRIGTSSGVAILQELNRPENP